MKEAKIYKMFTSVFKLTQQIKVIKIMNFSRISSLELPRPSGVRRRPQESQRNDPVVLRSRIRTVLQPVRLW